MKPIRSQTPILLINPETNEKMWQLVGKTNSEIAWHGFIKKLDNIYYLYDIVLYPQEVTGATVTAPEKDYAEWIEHMFENRKDIANMRFHGHSHVNMGVSPSGVDMGYRESLIKNEKDFYIFIIMNKKEDLSIELYDVKNNIVYETDDINIRIGTDKTLQAMKDESWYRDEFKKYIKERQICSIIPNHKNSSTQAQYKDKYTSSDAEQWERRYPNYWYGLE